MWIKHPLSNWSKKTVVFCSGTTSLIPSARVLYSRRRERPYPALARHPAAQASQLTTQTQARPLLARNVSFASIRYTFRKACNVWHWAFFLRFIHAVWDKKLEKAHWGELNFEKETLRRDFQCLFYSVLNNYLF